MLCPVCKDESMAEERVLGTVSIDRCTTCGGIWFDKGEIGNYLQFNKDIPDFKKVIQEARESSKQCARCSVPMVEIKYSPSLDIMIDYCRDCGAVWLDGNELDQLVAGSADPGSVKMKVARAMFELRKNANQPTLTLACPNCNTQTLRAFETSEGVTIDMCDDCKGMWFDKGEIATTVELSSDIPNFDQVIAGARGTQHKCPHCRENLVEFSYTPDGKLDIDYCQGCGGIWLDSNELKLLEEIAPTLESAGQRFGRTLRDLHEQGYVLLGIG